MTVLRPRRNSWNALTVAAALLGALVAPLGAQSLTEGALRGEVVLTDGTPVTAVNLTLEDPTGIVIRQFRSDIRGRFNLSLLAPGRYSMLVEKSGFQPLRQRGIDIVADAATQLRIRIVRRPPPISTVEEVAIADQRLVRSAPAIAAVLSQGPASGLAPRSDITEAGRNGALVVPPRDQTSGFATSFGGLPQPYVRLIVDGLAASWFRHPGAGIDVGGAPVYSRLLFDQVQAFTQPTDAELGGGNGGMVTAVSRRGTNRFRFSPFASWSGAIGQPTLQNPGDSSISSFQGGAVISGVIVPDRANFIVGLDYQALEMPTGLAWDDDAASFGGSGVSLAGTIAGIAQDSFGRPAGRFVAPTVRRTTGGSGGFRVDWRLNSNNTLFTRANFGRQTEENPEVRNDVLTGAGGELDARDFSAGAALVSVFSPTMANEFRFGIRRSSREWTGPSLPTSYFVAEGAGIGASPTLPGDFTRTSVDFAETFQLAFGSSAEHRMKVGLQYSNGHWEQDYLYGQNGIFSFGGLDGFGQGRGAFFVAEAPQTKSKSSMEEVGLFGQLIYRVSPRFSVLGAVRYDRQKYPRQGSQPIKPNQQFQALFGLQNARVPDDNNNVGPRLGMMYEGGRNKEWLVGAGLSRQYGALDPATFAEARLADGPLTIRRGVGNFSTWPALPDTVLAPRVGQRITLFSPTDKYRNPRTFKADLEVARNLASFTTVRLYGGYHHTDFLLRRTDLNILPGPTGLTQEGRPVYGTLTQEGGMLVATPGSNRAVTGYDLVSAMVSTGFQDHYETGVSISREAASGFSFAASYTFSRTRDNWLVSWSGDPADALSPFPEERLGNEWAEGVSDFDVPHRAVLQAGWRTPGRVPVSLGARYRFRSGFPFTPGFRPGVDANADGSGRNDPAFVDDAIPGLSQVISDNSCLGDQVGKIAERNSCREQANHALDLSAAVGLPVRSLGGRLELTVEVFNVASTPVGVVDRALVLVDPAGTLTTDPQGNVTLPLIANPRFGKFLSRRTEPRMVRFGLRVAY